MDRAKQRLMSPPSSTGSRRKLSSLAIYTEEDSSIDMSGLTPAADANDASDNSKINVSIQPRASQLISTLVTDTGESRVAILCLKLFFCLSRRLFPLLLKQRKKKNIPE